MPPLHNARSAALRLQAIRSLGRLVRAKAVGDACTLVALTCAGNLTFLGSVMGHTLTQFYAGLHQLRTAGSGKSRPKPPGCLRRALLHRALRYSCLRCVSSMFSLLGSPGLLACATQLPPLCCVPAGIDVYDESISYTVHWPGV